MSTCPSCGHGLEADDHFCAGCGLPVGMEHTGSLTSIIPIAGASGPITAVGAGIADSVAPGEAVLIVRRGPGEGTQFPLSGDVVTIGRTPDSGIFLDDVTVSRKHADLRHGATGWSIRDAGSLNGTYVNRKRVDDQQLRGGDELQIGKFRFVFLTGQDS